MKRLTDAELIHTELFTTDAYERGGLVLKRLPDGVTISSDVILEYSHARFEVEPVFCCKCGIAKHKHGYRVRRSDNVETLLGNCCAEPILGRKFVQGKADLLSRKRRKEYLQAIHEMAPRTLAALAELPSWYDRARALRDLRCRMRDVAPDVYELIEQAANREGELLTSEAVLTYDDDGNEERRNVLVRHILTGKVLLRRGDPVELPKTFERTLQQFREVAANTDAFKTPQLKAAVTRLTFTLEKLQILNEMTDAIYHFFSSRNLAGIQRWATLMSEGHDRRLRSSIRTGESSITNIRTGATVGPTFQIPNTTRAIFNIVRAAA